jgi:hypothetical protein
MSITVHGEDTLVSEVYKISKRGKEKHYEEILNAA